MLVLFQPVQECLPETREIPHALTRSRPIDFRKPRWLGEMKLLMIVVVRGIVVPSGVSHALI